MRPSQPPTVIGRHRIILVTLALLSGAVVSVADEPKLRPGADWPAFGGPRGDFSSPETGIRTDWADGKLPRVWDIAMGEGYVPPAVAAGRCYLFDRIKDRVRLRCVDATTGKEHWSTDYPTSYEDMYGYDGGPRAAPVVDGDRVYALGPAGVLRCVSTADGAERWRVDTAKAFGVMPNFFGCGSTPLVEGDLLIVQVGGSPPGSPPIHSGRTQPNGSCVVAFDKATGAVRYKVGDDLASYASPVVASVGDRRLGIVFARGGLLGFDAMTGKQRFHLPWRSRIVESVNAMTPVVVGEEVFFAECYGPGGAVVNVAGDEPRFVWQDGKGLRAKAIAAHWMTPVYDEGYLYGSDGRHEYSAQLRCVKWVTGEIMWSEKGHGRCSMTKIDGHIIVVTERGELLLINTTPRRFELVTRLKPTDGEGRPMLAYPAWAPAVVSRGMLYVRGAGRLVCYELIPPGGAADGQPE